MPQSPSFLLTALSVLLIGTAAAMLTAVFSTVFRLRGGESFLPPWPDRPKFVPWGGFSVGLVVVLWVVVNVGVSGLYAVTRSRLGVAPPAAVVDTQSDGLAKAAAGGLTPAAPARPAATESRTFSFLEQMFLVSMMNGLLMAVIPYALGLTSGATADDLGLTTEGLGQDARLGWKSFLLVTPFVMGVFAVAQYVWPPNRHPIQLMLQGDVSPFGIVVAYLSAVVFAPAAEELMFRGVVQSWLRRCLTPADAVDAVSPNGITAAGADGVGTPDHATANRPRVRWLPRAPGAVTRWAGSAVVVRYLPIVLTSLFFAVVHLDQMPAPVAIFPLSIALGVLYERTGTLFPSICLHALFNGFNTTLLVVALLSGHQVSS